MTQQTREWTQVNDPEQLTGEHDVLPRVLVVDDGMFAHFTPLARGEEPEAALADYAFGYETGGEEQQVGVAWDLYEYGQVVARGSYTFKACC